MEIKVFEHKDFGKVRTMLVDGQPYFVGKDVADILGYRNSRKAIADHVDIEDKVDGVTIRDSIGRDQTPILINASNRQAVQALGYIRSASGDSSLRALCRRGFARRSRYNHRNLASSQVRAGDQQGSDRKGCGSGTAGGDPSTADRGTPAEGRLL